MKTSGQYHKTDVRRYKAPYTDRFSDGSRLPPGPTAAAPGSPEKQGVMRDRALARLALHHPADARWEGDLRPALWLADMWTGSLGPIYTETYTGFITPDPVPDQ